MIASRHRENDALVMPLTRQRIGGIRVDSVNARVVDIEFSVIIAENKGIGLSFSRYVKVKLHMVSPLCIDTFSISHGGYDVKAWESPR